MKSIPFLGVADIASDVDRSSTDGKTWTNLGKIVAWPGLTNWDPVLFKDLGAFRLFWAPSDSEQFIATSKSANPTDPVSWSTPVRVTTASCGDENWWDFWPQPLSICRIIPRPLILTYTSERNGDGTKKIDGNIWLRLIFTFPLAH